MVRNYKRKIVQGNISKNTILSAVKAVKFDRVPVEDAADEFNIRTRALYRYCAKISDIELAEMEEDLNKTFEFGYSKHRMVTYLIHNIFSYILNISYDFSLVI